MSDRDWLIFVVFSTFTSPCQRYSPSLLYLYTQGVSSSPVTEAHNASNRGTQCRWQEDRFCKTSLKKPITVCKHRLNNNPRNVSLNNMQSDRICSNIIKSERFSKKIQILSGQIATRLKINSAASAKKTSCKLPDVHANHWITCNHRNVRTVYWYLVEYYQISILPIIVNLQMLTSLDWAITLWASYPDCVHLGGR